MELKFEASTIEVQRKLNTLEYITRMLAEQAAVKAAARAFLPSLKRATPVGPTGNLKRSMILKTARYGSGVVVGYIGPNWWNHGRHGHLVEAGTVRRATSAGLDRGIMPARPFFEPWVRANQAAIEARLKVELTKRINKEFGR